MVLLLTEGQMSDHRRAALMLPSLPRAKELLGDKGYDSNRFRKALAERGIQPCIPSKQEPQGPALFGSLIHPYPVLSRYIQADVSRS
ncbi:hypothetical protein [Muricoccus nepalensis]|uniref:hypothetical protein n=1 Tax=Muricoccus nepalensis TaxID=1854500 RepID=UPI0038D18D73